MKLKQPNNFLLHQIIRKLVAKWIWCLTDLKFYFLFIFIVLSSKFDLVLKSYLPDLDLSIATFTLLSFQRPPTMVMVIIFPYTYMLFFTFIHHGYSFWNFSGVLFRVHTVLTLRSFSHYNGYYLQANYWQICAYSLVENRLPQMNSWLINKSGTRYNEMKYHPYLTKKYIAINIVLYDYIAWMASLLKYA